MKRWIFITICWLLLLTPRLALAQDGIQLEVDSTDNPLLISGWLGEQLVGDLRLLAQGGDVESFTFLPSDLKDHNSEQLISRHNVSLVGEPTLQAGIPKDFQVTVTGLEQPGTYEGEIKMLLQGQAISKALTIDLTVVAKARPTLTPLAGSERLQLSLVNSSCWPNCWLAKLFLPASAFLESWQLHFDNTGYAEVTVLESTVVVRGQKTGYQLTDSELMLHEQPKLLAAKQIGTLPLTVTRTTIPPDHYTGLIYLTLSGRDEHLKIPVDLSVRSGPFWALFLLFVGIVLGRLSKYMQERGQPQAEALTEVNKVEALLSEAHEDDKKVLAPMVAAVRKLVYQEELERVTARLDAIRDGLSTFQELRNIESSLAGQQDDPDVQEVLAKIGQARQALTLKEDDKAKELLNQIKDELIELKNAPTMMGDEDDLDPDIVQAANHAEAAVAAAERATRELPPEPDSKWQTLKRGLILLSGQSDEIRAEATLWLVLPLLYAALLLGLLIVGMESLYVDKGTTFGATPFADYLGLVLWGLSADVASRSLSNLRGKK